jgi:hypothetical protein
MALPRDEYDSGAARDVDTTRVYQRSFIAGQADVIRELIACICKYLPLPTVVNGRQIEGQSLPVTIECGVDQVIQPFPSQAGVKGQYTARTREIGAPGLCTVPSNLELIRSPTFGCGVLGMP